MTILKSIGAVLAGFLTVAILSTATDFALSAAGIFPDIVEGKFTPWMLGIALLYRIAYTILGGYVVAALAPAYKMRHVFVLAFIGLAAASAGAVAGWNLSDSWYPIAIAVTAVPATWLGGYLRTKKAY